ncbi:caspase recruitment domain-containing protein 8-like isoform X2 [Plectropomus leopardus]|uniref:caspase recruitment domain-containing protein 8-like isoform X2 n=1 Tax=Plectropomus leopardus TaxID=160734 RepID=UPI001C4CDC04|nr:caspase recruitment domain-containing protein 8-like isoform X2 [Plectropomus leopardus]
MFGARGVQGLGQCLEFLVVSFYYPSTSSTELDVSEDSRDERVDEEDQLSPVGPESSKQQQPECEEFQDNLKFTPELLIESGKTTYRFRCPRPGVFQCLRTNLVFDMAQSAELLYSIVQWDESLLGSAGKMAAGPLFNITCSEDAAVSHLHLPHCETTDAGITEGHLSVAHIADDEMSILTPLKITDTHVVVSVPHFSVFGLVMDFVRWILKMPFNGQVLLFLGQPNPKTRRKNLYVLLLPSNIPLDPVSAQQRGSVNIHAPSKCKLIKDERYTIHCPQASKIQPAEAEFDLEFGPNYHPTFEIRLPTTTDEATLRIRDKNQSEVWIYDADLTGTRGTVTRRNVPAEDSSVVEDSVLAEDSVPAAHSSPAEKQQLEFRTQFIQRTSQPVLDQLLDKLLEDRVINDAEMQSIKIKAGEEKARELFDTVRNKGRESVSVLMNALREADPWLYSALRWS